MQIYVTGNIAQDVVYSQEVQWWLISCFYEPFTCDASYMCFLRYDYKCNSKKAHVMHCTDLSTWV